MRLAIVGSRNFKNYKYLSRVLDKHKCTVIISGGARGVDLLAEKYADEKNITKVIYPANWDEHGKSAGFIRNKLIVKDCDELVAFWDGKSKGTRHSIDLAKQDKKMIYIYLIKLPN